VRADRLLAILMHLQTRGRTTTSRLAERFEVSRRTILRDLYALRVAGFPVYTVPGPGGGCYLYEEFRNTLTQLTTDEIAALFLSADGQPLEQLGLAPKRRAALLKLQAAIPEPRHSRRNRLAERLLVDPTPWVDTAEPTDHLSSFYEATMGDRIVVATFERRYDIAITRRVAPYGLVAKAGSWYLVWAGEDGRLRADRLSSVRSVSISDAHFERSTSFDLQAFWTTWEANRRTAMRPSFRVKLRVQATAQEFVRDTLGERRGAFPQAAQPAEEWTVLKVSFASFEEARRELLALGGAVEVLEPPALRVSIADYAHQTGCRYRGPAQDIS